MYKRKLTNTILTNFQVRITSINLMLMQKLTKDRKQRITKKGNQLLALKVTNQITKTKDFQQIFSGNNQFNTMYPRK
jgi:hypothetical protein